MKFLFALTALVGSAFAQSAFIGYPYANTSLPAGQNMTVMVTRPDTLTGSTEVSIVLSLQSCEGHAPAGTCDGFDASEDLGRTLYLGAFNPQFQGPVALPPHQNFTVNVPANVPKGAAALTLSHWSLTGAGPFNLFEVKNITVNVV